MGRIVYIRHSDNKKGDIKIIITIKSMSTRVIMIEYINSWGGKRKNKNVNCHK